MGDGMFPLASVRIDCHLEPVFLASGDISFDAPLCFLELSPYDGPVMPFCSMVVELKSQVAFGFRRFGNHQQAGGVFINAVNDSRTPNTADTR